MKLIYKDRINTICFFLHSGGLYIHTGLTKKAQEKHVYKDHPIPTKCGPYTQVVFICKFNNMESIPRGPVKCGLYKQVVFT